MKSLQSTQAEKLELAIGDISDELLERADKSRNAPAKSRRPRSIMWQFVPVAAGFVLVAITAMMMLHFLAPEPPTTPLGEDTSAEDSTYISEPSTTTSPAAQHLVGEDLVALTAFIEIISGNAVNWLRPFERIEDIPLIDLLWVYMVFDDFHPGLPPREEHPYVRGWRRDTINDFFRERFNSDFSLDNYPLNNFDWLTFSHHIGWCAENEMVMTYFSDGGGSILYVEIENIYAIETEDGIFVTATRQERYAVADAYEVGVLARSESLLYNFRRRADNSGFDILQLHRTDMWERPTPPNPNDPPCNCHVCDPHFVPTTQQEMYEHFINSMISVGWRFPEFDDINTVGLWHLLYSYRRAHCHYSFHNYYGEELLRLAGDREVNWAEYGFGIGVSPERLNEFYREHYNPNFSIESYNYRAFNADEYSGVVWDAERGLLVQVHGFIGGYHAGRSAHVVDVREVGDTYHVYAAVVLWNEPSFNEVELVRCVFVRNASGRLNVMSLHNVNVEDVTAPDWVIELVTLQNRAKADLDLAYSLIRESPVHRNTPEEWQRCPEWCETTTRTICDHCINNWLSRVLQEKFREHLLTWNSYLYD